MTEYNEGDLIEATKGEELIRGRAGGRGVIGQSGRTVWGVEDEGWTVTVIEKAAPPLPTEPGTIIRWHNDAYLPQIAQLDAKDGSMGWYTQADSTSGRWVTNSELTGLIDCSPLTRLEPVEVTAEKIALSLDDDGWNEPARAVRANFGATK